MTRSISAKRAAASLLLGLSLAGCAVGPDYQAPDVKLARFHSAGVADAAGRPRPVPSLDRWWTGFNDPMLVTVVERALEQNLDLAASAARVRQARAAAGLAFADLLPTADLSGTAQAERQSLRSPLGAFGQGVPGYNRYQREFNVGGVASWEIDLFGGLRRDLAAAEAEAAAAEATHAGTRVSIAAEAADAYLQIRGYQARLDVAGQLIDTDTHLLDLVQTRRRLGTAEDREAAQAEALLKQARATVPSLRIGLETQLNRLDVLMGVQPGTYARELGGTESIPVAPSIAGADQPVDVLRRRPDIIAAERHLAASSERIGAAISDYYPKISLAGILGFDSTSSNHLFTQRAFQPAGTAALRWRLFDFGKVDAEVEQAHGANAEALAAYRQAVLHAAEDVENALTTYSQTEVKLTELKGEVDALHRARDLSERAYRAGSIPLTDVLDASRLLLTAQDELNAGRADAARAAVQTYRSLGGGWDWPETAAVAAVP